MGPANYFRNPPPRYPPLNQALFFAIFFDHLQHLFKLDRLEPNIGRGEYPMPVSNTTFIPRN